MEAKQTNPSSPTQHPNQPDYQRQEISQMHGVSPAYPSTAQLQPMSPYNAAAQYHQGLVIAKCNCRSTLIVLRIIKMD